MPELGGIRRALRVSAPAPDALAQLRQQWSRTCLAIPPWKALEPDIVQALGRHGDAGRWLDALEAMPQLGPAASAELGACIRVGSDGQCSPDDQERLRAALHHLIPWRKGPFELYGVAIDAEWRSDRKWERVAAHLGSLSGDRVLDVGAGNGYYLWRMRASGAELVVGVDPSTLFQIQHAAVCRYMPPQHQTGICLLPLRLEDLPPAPEFDAVFSMGVLYHRRDPVEHLVGLRRFLRPGGRLVLETLVIDADGGILIPSGRYAAMRNVWAVPGGATLLAWLTAAGFRGGAIADVSLTTPDEQRSTEWMPYSSLADALDSRDPSLTREGYPAPRRAIVLAHR
jgi:tRNA (mo5U34)-methyltransferase